MYLLVVRLVAGHGVERVRVDGERAQRGVGLERCSEHDAWGRWGGGG